MASEPMAGAQARTARVATISREEIELSRWSFWGRPVAEREAAFALLRQERPIPFFEEPRYPWGTRGPGFYALTRHADIVEASRRPDVFSSAQGVLMWDPPQGAARTSGSMINMDDPRHARLRRIVARGFTPRMTQKVEYDIRRAASRIVDDVIDQGGCDFVTEISAKLPLKIICDMMGVPESGYQFVFDRSNIVLGAGDPEYTPVRDDIPTAVGTAAAELSEMVQELARHRAEHPTDDLTSVLVNANIDGERLTSRELAEFFSLLVTAGNETTRNAISHGLILLTDHPDQKALWASDFERYAPGAVEEIVRVASPVMYMRRSVTQDCELAGQLLKAGDKALMFYWSANRDETVFDEPHRFDITRDPNPHIGFGAAGPHFCLGAHLARREITVMFRELLRRVPDIHAAGEPARLRSSFLNGIKHLPCEFTPEGGPR